MNNLRQSAQQSLEAYDKHEPLAVVMEDLRAALAEHYCDTHCTWADHAPGCALADGDKVSPTEPVQEPAPKATPSQSKPLTDEEVMAMWHERFAPRVADAIKKAHGIKE